MPSEDRAVRRLVLDIVRRFMGRVITDNWDARWIETIDFEIESSRFALLSRAYGFAILKGFRLDEKLGRGAKRSR